MKHILMVGIACLSLCGCTNTAEGVKEDTAQNTKSAKVAGEEASIAAKKATERMMSATEKAGKNAGDALTLTPKVKHAITDDKELNNVGNLIDVESGDNEVRLTGHVLTQAMKNRASSVAKKAIEEAHVKNTLVNELKIKK